MKGLDPKDEKIWQNEVKMCTCISCSDVDPDPSGKNRRKFAQNSDDNLNFSYTVYFENFIQINFFLSPKLPLKSPKNNIFYVNFVWILLPGSDPDPNECRSTVQN